MYWFEKIFGAPTFPKEEIGKGPGSYASPSRFLHGQEEEEEEEEVRRSTISVDEAVPHLPMVEQPKDQEERPQQQRSVEARHSLLPRRARYHRFPFQQRRKDHRLTVSASAEARRRSGGPVGPSREADTAQASPTPEVGLDDAREGNRKFREEEAPREEEAVIWSAQGGATTVEKDDDDAVLSSPSPPPSVFLRSPFSSSSFSTTSSSAASSSASGHEKGRRPRRASALSDSVSKGYHIRRSSGGHARSGEEEVVRPRSPPRGTGTPRLSSGSRLFAFPSKEDKEDDNGCDGEDAAGDSLSLSAQRAAANYSISIFVLVLYNLLEIAAFICFCVGILSDLFQSTLTASQPITPVNTTSISSSVSAAAAASFAADNDRAPVTVFSLSLWYCRTSFPARPSGSRDGEGVSQPHQENNSKNIISTVSLFSDACPERYNVFEAAKSFAAITLIVFFACFLYAFFWWISQVYRNVFPFHWYHSNSSHPAGEEEEEEESNDCAVGRVVYHPNPKRVTTLAVMTLFGAACGAVVWGCMVSLYTADGEALATATRNASLPPSSQHGTTTTAAPMSSDRADGKCPYLGLGFSCDSSFYSYQLFYPWDSSTTPSLQDFRVAYSGGLFVIIIGWSLHTLNLVSFCRLSMLWHLLFLFVVGLTLLGYSVLLVLLLLLFLDFFLRVDLETFQSSFSLSS
eukprot:gene7485-5272_t